MLNSYQPPDPGRNYRLLFILTVLLFFHVACDDDYADMTHNEIEITSRLFTVDLFPEQNNIQSLTITAADNRSLYARSPGDERQSVFIGTKMSLTGTENGVRVISEQIDTTFLNDIELTGQTGGHLLSRFEIETGTGRTMVLRGYITVRTKPHDLGITIQSYEHDLIAYLMAPAVTQNDPDSYKETMAVVFRTNLYATVTDNGTHDTIRESKRAGIVFGTQHPEAYHYDAIQSTDGSVMYARDKPVILFSTEICGGMTATPEMVWHDLTPQPYYQVVICESCLAGDGYQWTNGVRSSALGEVLFGRRDNVEVWISKYYENGRPQFITARMGGRDKTLPVEEFRQQIAERFDSRIILSDWFEIKDDDGAPGGERGPRSIRITYQRDSSDANIIYFEGWGIGHGVGLCRDAASKHARAGKTFSEILHYYYPRITRGRIDSE